MKKKIEHAGVYLKEVLEEKDMEQLELSSYIDRSLSHLNAIVLGEKRITVEMAIRLECAGFKTVNFWTFKQRKCDLQKVRIDKKEELREVRKRAKLLRKKV